MAKKDVLAYNKTSNRLEVPQAGDDYQFPRNVELTEGMNLTLKGGGTLSLQDTAHIVMPYTHTTIGSFLKSATGGLMVWDTTMINVGDEIRYNNQVKLSYGQGHSEGMIITTAGNNSNQMWGFEYEQFVTNVEIDKKIFQKEQAFALPFSFQNPYTFSSPGNADQSHRYDSIQINTWDDVESGLGDSGYYATLNNLPDNANQCDIMPFSGRLTGLTLAQDGYNDTLTNVKIRLERAMRQTVFYDTGGTDIGTNGRLAWQFVDSISLSPFNCGGKIASDKVTLHTTGDTASPYGSGASNWGETGGVIRSLWFDSLTQRMFHAGDTIRFSLQFDTTNATMASRAPTLRVTTNWAKLNYTELNGMDSATQASFGLFPGQRYLGYPYIYGDTSGPIGGDHH